jgi:type I restriction enzyme S subunit
MNTIKKFNTTNLGSIAKVQTGPFGSQLHERDYVEKGAPIISVEHLGYGRIIKNDIPCVSESDVLRLKKFLLKTGDIVFSRVGSVDRSVLIRQEEDGWLFSGRCLRVRVTTKDVLPAYLYYYFTQNSFRQYVRNNAVGATMPSLNSSILRRLKILYPSLSKQKQINDILSGIDDTLANNYTRIQLLEESARLLFREWFVYFRFPRLRQGFGGQAGHEKVKMVDGAPEGWVKGLLEDIATVKKGKNITFEQAIEGDIPVVGGGLEPTYYHNKANVSAPVITISASGANAGFVNMYDTDIWASDCSYIDEHSTKYIYFLYLRLKSLQTAIFGFQVGAAQPHVYPRDLNRLKLLIAPDNLCVQFEQLVTPIFNFIKNLKLENQKLAQARDLLLPRLMSGAIEV